MEKIPGIYLRNHDTDHRIRDEKNPDALWVFNGEGVPTRKFDGTCCLIRVVPLAEGRLSNKLYARYDLKRGRTAPPNFEPVGPPDPITGHCPGWVPVSDAPQFRWHREAFGLGFDYHHRPFAFGTYELIGPKINGNPERMVSHWLIRHENCDRLADVPTGFEALREFLRGRDIEGIVWHHPGGRMAKIKGRDFGLSRPQRAAV